MGSQGLLNAGVTFIDLLSMKFCPDTLEEPPL